MTKNQFPQRTRKGYLNLKFSPSTAEKKSEEEATESDDKYRIDDGINYSYREREKICLGYVDRD